MQLPYAELFLLSYWSLSFDCWNFVKKEVLFVLFVYNIQKNYELLSRALFVDCFYLYYQLWYIKQGRPTVKILFVICAVFLFCCGFWVISSLLIRLMDDVIRAISPIPTTSYYFNPACVNTLVWAGKVTSQSLYSKCKSTFGVIAVSSKVSTHSLSSSVNPSPSVWRMKALCQHSRFKFNTLPPSLPGCNFWSWTMDQ